jgi:hypothetical protein
VRIIFPEIVVLIQDTDLRIWFLRANILWACPGTTDLRRLTFRAGILDRGGER